MTRFWLSSMNNELKNKRTHEELLVTLNQWSSAKSRLSEEISTKIERSSFASNPSKLAVMSQTNKALLEKIYRNEHDFLNSDESSLNTTYKSNVEVQAEVINRSNVISENYGKEDDEPTSSNRDGE